MEKETKHYDELRWNTSYDPEDEKPRMTLKEAIEEDSKCADLAKKFPSALKDAALRLLHLHPSESLRGLVDDVFEQTRPPAEAKEDDAKEPKKEEGGAGADDEKKKKSAPRHPIRNRQMLRSFAVEHACLKEVEGAGKVWQLKDPKEIERLRLPKSLEGDALAAFLARRAELGSKKRKKAASAAGEKAPTKKKEGAGEPGSPPPAKKAKKEGEGKEGEAKTPAKKKKKEDGAGAGAGPESAKKEKEKKEKAPYTKTFEDEEAYCAKNPTSMKAILFTLLKTRGPEGMTAEELQAAIEKDNLRDLSKLAQPTNTIRSCMTHDECFCRVRPLYYSIRTLPGVVPLAPGEKGVKRKGEEGAEKPKKKKKEGAGEPGSPPPAKKAKKEGEGKDGEAKTPAKKKPEDGAGAGTPKPKPLPKLVKGVAAAYEDRPADVLQGAAEVRRLQRKVGDIKAHMARLSAEATQTGASPAKSPEKKAAVASVAAIHARAAQECPKFELPEDLRAYKGDDADRKLKSEWRQKVQDAERALKKQRDDWITRRKQELTAEREASIKASRQAGEDVKLLEKALARWERELARVEKDWERDRKKEEATAAKAQREKEREEERERKRREAEEAKRYPMEDLELLKELRAAGANPPEDLPLPAPLDAAAQSTEVPLLLVSDFLACFKDHLGLAGRCPTLQQLRDALADDTLGWGLDFETCDKPNLKALDALPYRRLTRVYEILLENLLEGADKRGEADDFSRMERRWLYMLDIEGAWPEIVARYVLTDDPAYLPADVAEAARALRSQAPEKLSLAQHARLLVHLCDLLMDGGAVREGIEERLEQIEELDKQRYEERKGIWAERRKLKEEEDEERARRREEEEARRGEEGEGETGGEKKKDGGGGGKGKDKPRETTPQPPSMELPEELREFKGDAGDRKAVSEFRQRQQAERRRLEKELAKWNAELLRSQREANKKKQEEEKVAVQLARRREELKEREQILQENYELERSKIAIRAPLLGQDRHRRRYYWGLGGRKDRVYYELEGTWGVLDSIDQVRALLEALDPRGVRERALREELEASLKSIERAFRVAATGGGEDKEPAHRGRGHASLALGIRASGRERKQAQVLYNPDKAHLQSTHGGRDDDSHRRQTKAAVRGANASARETQRVQLIESLCKREVPQGVFLGQTSALEEVAFSHGLYTVFRTAQRGVRVGLVLPEGFMDRLEALAHGNPPAELLLASPGAKPGASATGHLAGLRRGFKGLLEELEAGLLALAGQDAAQLALRAREEEERRQQEGEDEDDVCPWLKKGVLEFLEEDVGAPLVGARRFWRSHQERTTWKYDFERTDTFGRLCYCAGALEWCALPLLRSLEREKAKEGLLKLEDGEELSDEEEERGRGDAGEDAAGTSDDEESDDESDYGENLYGGRKKTRGQKAEAKAHKKGGGARSGGAGKKGGKK